MVGGVEVLGGVLIFRRITTAHMAALEAEPEVHPGIVHFKTFFAALAAGRHREISLFDVFTDARHFVLSCRGRTDESWAALPYLLQFHVSVMEDTGSSTRRGQAGIQKLPGLRFGSRPNQ
jgi:hypothetical protein